LPQIVIEVLVELLLILGGGALMFIAFVLAWTAAASRAVPAKAHAHPYRVAGLAPRSVAGGQRVRAGGADRT